MWGSAVRLARRKLSDDVVSGQCVPDKNTHKLAGEEPTVPMKLQPAAACYLILELRQKKEGVTSRRAARHSLHQSLG